MADGDDDPLAKEYERNTQLEHVFAGVLVVGLAIELINAAVWFEGVKTIAEMFAVSLIVLGVAGEVWFGNRARIAGDKQLAEYRVRIAEANLKALETQMELERLKAPRFLSEEQRVRITEKMRQFAGQEFSGAVTMGVSDALTLWRSIAAALRNAGWVIVSPSGLAVGDPPASIPTTARPGIGIMTPANEHIGEVMPCAKALAEALAAEGVAAIESPFHGVAAETNPKAIRIEIGPKT
jgi:hypothetical protein